MTESDLPPLLAALPADQRAAILADAQRRLDDAPEPSIEAVKAVGELVRRFALARIEPQQEAS